MVGTVRGKNVWNAQRFLNWLIFSACLLFVLWQCYLALEKFLKVPRATSLTIQESRNYPIPRFTICPLEKSLEFNQEILDGCGSAFTGGRYEKYKSEGRWIGYGDTNCTDPKILHDNIMVKPKDLLHYARIKYFLKSYATKVHQNSSSWIPVYKRDRGRCFELTIKPENQFNYGIREVEIYIWFKAGSKQRIYFHPPGEFLASRQRQYLDLGINEKVELDLEHQIDNVLSLGQQSCHPDPDYDRDQCMQRILFNTSMSQFGCTTPWGPNKDHICTNETIGKLVQQNYMALLYFKNVTDFDETCPRPCTIMKLRPGLAKTSFQKYISKTASASLHVKLQDLITVTDDQYAYTWLSLVAEVGGYVGLFLGFSVYQVTDVIDGLFRSHFF